MSDHAISKPLLTEKSIIEFQFLEFESITSKQLFCSGCRIL